MTTELRQIVTDFAVIIALAFAIIFGILFDIIRNMPEPIKPRRDVLCRTCGEPCHFAGPKW